MAKNNSIQGEILYSWKAYEHQPQASRSTTWYLAVGAVVVLILIYAIWVGQWFLAGLALAIALAVFATSRFNPREFEHVLTDQGVGVGEKFYLYSTLKSFWVVADDAGGTLYILPAKRIAMALALQLEEADVEQIRTILSKFLVEDPDQGNDPIDRISRFLKL